MYVLRGSIDLMHTTPPANAQKLYKIISEAYALPADDYDHHQFLKKLKMTDADAWQDFRDYVDDTFLEATKGGRNNRDTEILQRHWYQILMNLTFTMFQQHWLCVSMDKNFYTNSFHSERLNLSYNAVRTIIRYLDDEGLVIRNRGKKFSENPVMTRIFPTPPLMSMIYSYFLSIGETIEPPYICINKPEADWESIQKLPTDHPELLEMRKINEFLQPHQWACKGPVKLTYKNNAFQGGRLVTPFQNLPDRRLRIRINTLIDGEALGEVDFSANHLRLYLAFNGGVDAGETPYEDIGEAAGGFERSRVKIFITVAMGAADINSAKHALYQQGFKNKELQNLIEAATKVFPALKLFSGWGIYAQNFEGQILKNVMLAGVDKGIVALPVHDAIAIQLDYLSWACDEMKEQWDKSMEVTGLARVTQDIPD